MLQHFKDYWEERKNWTGSKKGQAPPVRRLQALPEGEAGHHEIYVFGLRLVGFIWCSRSSRSQTAANVSSAQLQSLLEYSHLRPTMGMSADDSNARQSVRLPRQEFPSGWFLFLGLSFC